MTYPDSKKDTDMRKTNDRWVAIMVDGSRIVRENYITQAINNHSSELASLTWIQQGRRYRLNFIHGHMSVDFQHVPWPKRLPYVQDNVTFKAGKRWASSPTSPSPILNCVFLGVEIDCGGYTTTMLMTIFENGSWDWEFTSSVSDIDAQCVTGVNYWKIYYVDATIITARQMDWEDAPSDNVLVVLLFFRSPHPAAPRARLHGFNYYWKDGDTFGFSRISPDFARGNVKNGVWVSDEIWHWANLVSRKDFVVDGYTNPSPEW